MKKIAKIIFVLLTFAIIFTGCEADIIHRL